MNDDDKKKPPKADAEIESPGAKTDIDKQLLDDLLMSRYEVDGMDPDRDAKVEKIANMTATTGFDAQWLVDDASVRDDGTRVVFLKALNLQEPIDGRRVVKLMTAMLKDLEAAEPVQ